MNDLKVSVCVPYFERLRSLEDSIRSMVPYASPSFEVVVADDGSSIDQRAASGRSFGVKVVHEYLGPMKLYGLNPCVPINRAVKRSSNPVIVIQSPEIIHDSPILEKMLESLDESTVVCAACFCPDVIPQFQWYQHSVHSPTGYPFCNMMHKSLFEKAGGYDERFRANPGYDDPDFVNSLKKVGAKFVWRDDCQTIHRKRDRVKWKGTHAKNREIFLAKWGEAPPRE